MKSTTLTFTLVGLLALASASAYFMFKAKENTRIPTQVVPTQVTVPLQHSARQEQFWNSHLLKVERQGNSVKLISDGLLRLGPKETQVLRVGEGFTVPDRHGSINYTLRHIQADGAILECYSHFYRGYRRLPPGESEFETSRTWIKLKWR